MTKDVLKYLQPNAAIPIDMETTSMLVNALKDAYAEQEPVAWKWRVKDFCDWPKWSVSLKRPADSGHAQYPRTEGYEDIPLYTHPPQRTWVELAEEKIKEIWLKGKDHGDDWQDVLALARAFEAELKKVNT
jgi:hypothetical protein